MPDSKQAHKDLQKCLKDANNDPAKIAVCQTNFEATGGGATTDGGKVFSTSDGEATSTTNGGKVFRGGTAV